MDFVGCRYHSTLWRSHAHTPNPHECLCRKKFFLALIDVIALRRYAPKYLEIPPKPLVRTELERARQNLALLDLPFTRVNQLLKGLYKRKVMGKRKPTLRRMVYAVFQLELHAWSASLAQQQKKRVKRRADVQGEYLEDLRGLHFEQVLERLTILHYGKHRCLSYAVQMDEYQLEVNHISLQILQTCISMWLFKRRMGRTVGGHTWPLNPVWAKMPEAFEMAIEGIATTRMRSLVILRGEVERRSRPALIDVQLPKKQRLVDKMAGTDGDGQGKRRFLSCKKKRRDGPQEIEIMDVQAGATSEPQTQESSDERLVRANQCVLIFQLVFVCCCDRCCACCSALQSRSCVTFLLARAFGCGMCVMFRCLMELVVGRLPPQHSPA